MKTETEEKQFIEEIGVMLDGIGFPPLTARLMGLLFLRYPEGLTFTQILDFIGASKSSVSNAINSYINDGKIKYYTKPGDRKRYFTLVLPMGSLEEFETKIKGIDVFLTVLKKICVFRENDNPIFNDNCQKLSQLFSRIQNLILLEIKKFREEINE